MKMIWFVTFGCNPKRLLGCHKSLVLAQECCKHEVKHVWETQRGGEVGPERCTGLPMYWHDTGSKISWASQQWLCGQGAVTTILVLPPATQGKEAQSVDCQLSLWLFLESDVLVSWATAMQKGPPLYPAGLEKLPKPLYLKPLSQIKSQPPWWSFSSLWWEVPSQTSEPDMGERIQWKRPMPVPLHFWARFSSRSTLSPLQNASTLPPSYLHF